MKQPLRVWNMEGHVVTLMTDDSLSCSCQQNCRALQIVNQRLSDNDVDFILTGQKVAPSSRKPSSRVRLTNSTGDTTGFVSTVSSDPGRKIRQRYAYASKSKPGEYYETILYANGTTSCNCPGWTRRTGPNGERTCRHCEEVEYRYKRLGAVLSKSPPLPQATVQQLTRPPTKPASTPQQSKRKFDFD